MAVPIYILTNSAQAFVGAVLKSQEQTWHHSSHRCEQHIAARQAVGWWTKNATETRGAKYPMSYQLRAPLPDNASHTHLLPPWTPS